MWNAPGAKLLGNDVRFGRDGIFVVASRRNTSSGDRLRDLRFAVRYMYTTDSEVSGNASVGNRVGHAIMCSQRLAVRGNLSDGDRDNGPLFNRTNGSQTAGNMVRRRLVAPARADSDAPADREHAALLEGTRRAEAPP